MHKRFLLACFLSCFALLAHNQTRSLSFYLKEGIRNSPLLNDYMNQVNSAVSDSLLIKAAKKPLVEARSQLQFSPSYKNFGYDEVITDGGNYTAVMGVSQAILNKKELINKYKAVDLQKQSVNNSSRISANELNKLITEQYLTSFSCMSDYLFNRSFLELFKKENEIVKEFVNNGVCKQTDYLSLVVESQSQEILVNQLNSQYRKELMLLNQLCGLNDSSLLELEVPQLIINGTPDIAKAPSYLQYKIDSLRIENDKMAIDIRYKPKINWFADAGILTHNPWNFYRHFGYSAGISLNLPVYDGKQREIAKQKLEFNENSRIVYQSRFRQQYYQQIRQMNVDLKALNELTVRMETQIKTSDQLVKALREQLEAGIIQMTEYITAVKNFRTMSRSLNMINIQKLQVINEMNFLLTQ
jgi:outer membrane protein TolC